MTAYSNIINETVEATMSGDGFNARTLAPAIYDKISREDRKRTSIATITKDLREAANNIAKSAIKARDDKQLGFNFLLLPGTVSVDDDGAKIKLTLSLSRLEFRKAVENRRKKESAIGEVAFEMETAEKVAAPYWDKHPDWTFGQCLEQAAKDAIKPTAV
ncbi:hypothetical protein EM858_04135 [Agrobacterium sp. CNPSo 2736]|uniref:hypothetical protein n=1 Tax=Agrobacterium sp. CNPSo 2736 TaxID=2499627 RepID=UPI000FDC7DD7|nr:hypothetical protein [Agrobacterium sp. CNPSo 2736]RVT80192.1 hypothetical protein EM858_04135 [Agrobacterium sp. CNPSo 2736]